MQPAAGQVPADAVSVARAVMSRTSRSAFTLIEVMIVVVIVGILAAIAVNTTNPLLPDAADGQPACAGPKGAVGSRPGR